MTSLHLFTAWWRHYFCLQLERMNLKPLNQTNSEMEVFSDHSNYRNMRNLILIVDYKFNDFKLRSSWWILTIIKIFSSYGIILCVSNIYRATKRHIQTDLIYWKTSISYNTPKMGTSTEVPTILKILFWVRRSFRIFKIKVKMNG